MLFSGNLSDHSPCCRGNISNALSQSSEVSAAISLHSTNAGENCVKDML